MAHLTIRLLGPVQIALNGESVTHFESEKARALLAYLAAEPDRPHRREVLAEMFWPDRPEGAARANLRHTLACLRRVIGDRAARPPLLLPTRHTIQFNDASDAWIDVAAFSTLVLTQPPTGLAANSQTMRQLEEAVQLYRGPFLEDVWLADSAAYEEWRVLRREHFNRLVLDALWRLTGSYEHCGEYEQALAYARRELELEPWDEAAQQQVMRLLALSGRRAAALVQYEICRRVLAEELGVEPAAETTRLYEQIQQGELTVPLGVPILVGEAAPVQRLPGFLAKDTQEAEPTVFVAREREMAFLNAHLSEALAGRGGVVFVTGGAGRGKTALLAEFGRQAMEAHADLLTAVGNCNAYSGSGDPYLPFREILEMLTGDVESRWLAGAITTVQARRLWNMMPAVTQALAQHGPQITGTLVAEQAFLARAALQEAMGMAGPGSAGWLEPLRQQIAQRQGGSPTLEGSDLFRQVTQVLWRVAESHPLLLVLDDLQWADAASIGLLFHLGRRLEATCILIAGAYRPVEVTLGRPATGTARVERHPLDKVLCEFKRTYGDVWLDLSDVEAEERRRFVDALVETEPNCLGENFREVLAEHTGGHPLFTVELLRAMQARGDLIRDEAGRWTQGPVLDWQTLPARVEGVIEERVGRLEPELREILSVASVEGEDFTAQVVAQVQKIEESLLLQRVAQELEMRHRLVVEQGEIPSGSGRLSRYKFGHVLVQNYLYQHLGQGERRLLHAKVAAVLEQLHGREVDEHAVQLAHHFSAAGDDGRAFEYYLRAAERAVRLYANTEAIAHYGRALEIAERDGQPAVAVAIAHRGRGLAYETVGDFERACADQEAALQVAREVDERQVEWRALLDLGKLWASRDYERTRGYFEQALVLARHMGDAGVLAASLNWMGNWHLNVEDAGAAVRHHAEALEIFERLGDERGLASTLDLLGIASLLGGDTTASVGYYDRAILLFRELDDQHNLASSLTGRGHAGGTTYTSLTLLPPTASIHPRRDFEEAIRITREIGSLAGEAWVLWSLGLLRIVQGRYGQAMKVIQRGLDVATQIGHREWIVGNRCALGVLHVELLAPEEARQQLESALTLAEDLRSQHWIHHATGALAAAHCLLDDWTQAQTCLETVLSAETPMDTLHRRYCWARRAEVVLGQGDPAVALDIVERLIDSAPGMSPGRVITFLWKLKGEALAAMGHLDEAISLLRAALENARATGERFLLWRIHASLGQLYHTTNRPSEAEDAFSTARELVQALADTVPDEALKDYFLHRAGCMLKSPP